MALTINTNLGSINGQRNLTSSSAALSTSMSRLSSGVRVNSAKDDAAGLAIADRMNSQVRGMTVAVRNANDGISLTQTAEGALGSLTDTLQRMRDLAVQASSGAAVSASDRAKMDTEFKALQDELMRVVQNSEFNGKKILNGDLEGGMNIQVGATSDTSSRIAVAVSNMSRLLAPVTKATLNPANKPLNPTLENIIARTEYYIKDPLGSSSVSLTNVSFPSGFQPDPYDYVPFQSDDLLIANQAAKLANAAVVAAQKATASPNDIALAKAASTANMLASAAIVSSSNNMRYKYIDSLEPTTYLIGAGLVPLAVVNKVLAADYVNQSNNSTTTATDAVVQAKSTTDSAQSSSLMIMASQLAEAAKSNILYLSDFTYEDSMHKITGDTYNFSDTYTLLDAGGFDAGIQSNWYINGSLAPFNHALNKSIYAGDTNSFSVDRNAQKALISQALAKAYASVSYVDDPLKTASANETDKASFIANNKLVLNASTAVDQVASDYALSAINDIDAAIAAIDTERSNLGSTQNRFTTTIANLQNGIENQSAAKSRIMDADFAVETANLSRAQILQQAGTAMLAQANQSGQTVMALLR